MDDQYDKLNSILIAITLFLAANFSGYFFQMFADCFYDIYTNNLFINLPPPNIDDVILENSIIDLFLSPSEFITVARSAFNIKSIYSSTGFSQPMQLACEIASLFNVILSLLFKRNLNYILGALIGLSLIPAFLLFMQYQFDIITYFLDSILTIP